MQLTSPSGTAGLLLFATTTCLAAQDLVLSRVAPATTRPPGMTNPGLVYDINHVETVLFGLGQTWLYSGTDWRQATTSTAPSTPSAHSMVWDLFRGRLVLFGGADAVGVPLNETWEWDGAQWTQIPLALAPVARTSAGLAFDGTTNTVILFGGIDATGNVLGDTWSFNGTTWTQLSPLVSPSARSDAMLVGVSSFGVTLFGGRLQNGASTGDTWIWNGTNWSQFATTPATAPPGRHSAVSTFDFSTGRILLSGGISSQVVPNPGGFPPDIITNLFIRDFWEFDGVAWTQRTVLGDSTSEFGRRMTWDLLHNRAVLFGGSGLGVDVTWELERLAPADAKIHAFGRECGNFGEGPSLERVAGTAPRPGGSIALNIHNVAPSPGLAFLFLGTSDTTWAGMPLPVALEPLGLPAGCRAWINLDVGVFLSAPGGSTSLTIPLANTPALLGASFFAQAFSVEVPPATRPGLVSNAVRVFLGN